MWSVWDKSDLGWQIMLPMSTKGEWDMECQRDFCMQPMYVGLKCISSSLCKLTSTAVRINKTLLYLYIFTLQTQTNIPTMCFDLFGELFRGYQGFLKGFMRTFSTHSDSVYCIIWKSLISELWGVFMAGISMSVHVLHFCCPVQHV